MKQLTIRGIPDELENIIRKEAAEKGVSLNRALVSLAVKSIGVNKNKSKKEKLYHDLDCFSGLWSESETEAFKKNLSDIRKIDKELWITEK